MVTTTQKTPELLAPAGNLEAGFAAFQYGADAVYLGLKRFSARADADNFEFEELDRLVGYAHGQPERKRVFVTLNTLVLQRELGATLGVLGPLADIGPDAIIVQDLGLAHVLRRSFPELSAHASTQLAAHNIAGVLELARLGFRRVTLARELTLEEIREIVRQAPCEIETFVHGALCYSYSGVCLFSSHLAGRSGNRGRCAYPCRDEWKVEEAVSGQARLEVGQGGYAFSMKDLCLSGLVSRLKETGVSSVKIEGRKKSPLYVAAACHAYRRLLDSEVEVEVEERKRLEEDIQAVFSRPSTQLYLRSRRNLDAIEPSVVGHQGIPIGKVEQISRREGRVFVRFETSRALGLHDGVQIELEYLGKMFGFGVEELWICSGRAKGQPRGARLVQAGTRVEIPLPEEGYPNIPQGSRVFCSSSQEVKARYRLVLPSAKDCRNPRPVDISLNVDRQGLHLGARLDGGSLGDPLSVTIDLDGSFEPAENTDRLVSSARACMEKLGDTGYDLRDWSYENPQALFVRMSALNNARRALIEGLEQAVGDQRRRRDERLLARWLDQTKETSSEPGSATALLWDLKLDRIDTLLELLSGGPSEFNEITLDIGRDSLAALLDGLARASQLFPKERFRLALPIITRAHEEAGLQEKLITLFRAGFTAWEGANIASRSFLDSLGGGEFSADWPLYATNGQSVRALLDSGFGRITLSPEDDGENLGELLASHGDVLTLVVYQDTPLFISESCPLAALAGRCPGPERCEVERLSLRSIHGNRVEVSLCDCRSVVTSDTPFCLAHRIPELLVRGLSRVRADFITRSYSAAEIRAVFGQLRAFVRFGHEGNYTRGLR